MASALASLKTTYTKTKQKLLSKNQQDDSNDILYHQEKERILKLEEIITRINKHANNSLRILQDVGRLQNDISSDIHSLYDDNDGTAAALQASQVAKDETNKLAEGLSTSFAKPAENFCFQFRDVKKKMDEFSKRKTEMDHHQTEVNKLREKASSANKLPIAEEKYRISQQSYENMRQELMRELPALYNERIPFFDQLLAFLIKSHLEYYTSSSREFERSSMMVATSDDNAVLAHSKVITPTEKSFFGRNVRSDPIFIAPKAARPLPQHPSETQPNTTIIHTSTPVSTSSAPQTQPQIQPQILQPQPQIQVQPQPQIQSQIQPQTQVTTPAISTNTSFQAKALHTFAGEEDVELSFQKGDIITIYSKDGDWWEGEINGVRGLLPSNYVQML